MMCEVWLVVIVIASVAKQSSTKFKVLGFKFKVSSLRF
jgi:hypothetical protein